MGLSPGLHRPYLGVPARHFSKPLDKLSCPEQELLRSLAVTPQKVSTNFLSFLSMPKFN
jgi:hypothetical protein